VIGLVPMAQTLPCHLERATLTQLQSCSSKQAQGVLGQQDRAQAMADEAEQILESRHAALIHPLPVPSLLRWCWHLSFPPYCHAFHLLDGAFCRYE